MADLRDGFALLADESCESGLKHCDVLLELPQLAPLLAGLSLNEQALALRKFLRAAVALAATKATEKQQASIMGAAAYIGLDPPQGKVLGPRQQQAAVLANREWDTIRRPPWPGKFIDTLVIAVSDFLDDEAALGEFIGKNRPAAQATAKPTSASPSTVADGQLLPVQPAYVHRGHLEAQFKEAVDAGAKLIILYGQPGMGKTTLAVELTRDLATKLPAPMVQVIRGQIAPKDVAALLALYEFQSPANPDPLVQLSTFLCSPLTQPFFVLDNLDSSDELSKLLPRTTKSVVVATCRRKGDIPLRHATYINVGKMTRTEATKLIKTYLSDLPDDGARYVAEMLGDYPLVLSYVAATCLNLNLSILEFSNAASSEAVNLAAGARTEEGTTLLAVLRFMISAIAERDPVALDLLVYTVFAAAYCRPPSLYMPFLTRYLSESGAGSVTRLRVFQAYQVLQNFALGTPSNIAGFENSPFHPFTAAILHKEFSDKLPGIERRIRALEITSRDEVEQFLAAIRGGRQCGIVLASEPEGEPLVMRYYIADELHYVEFVPTLFHLGRMGARIRSDSYSKSSEGSEGEPVSSAIDYDALEIATQEVISHLSYATLTRESKQIIREVYYEVVRTTHL